MALKTDQHILLSGIFAAALLAAASSARAQQFTGTTGSPQATTTTGGKQLPLPDPKFGGVMPTPALDRVAKAGLRHTNFHSTSLCSPTRAALITGRNHHVAGFGVVGELTTGFPGYDSMILKANGIIGNILKNNVLPLDDTTLARWNAPKPGLAAGRTEFTYSGSITGIPNSGAPNTLDKSYSITAEVTIPEAGAEGVIVADGGRFGGYALFLTKGEFGIGRGKPVFLYNLLDLKRTVWEGPELRPGNHTIRFDYTVDEPGLGKSGKGVLCMDNKVVAKNSMEHGTPVTYPEDETFDVGSDTRTGVAMSEHRYESPFSFTGTINRVKFELK
jgi:hypothetical protein